MDPPIRDLEKRGTQVGEGGGVEGSSTGKRKSPSTAVSQVLQSALELNPAEQTGKHRKTHSSKGMRELGCSHPTPAEDGGC